MGEDCRLRVAAAARRVPGGAFLEWQLRAPRTTNKANMVRTELDAIPPATVGGADTGIPLESVEQMRSALKDGSDAARRSGFHIYPQAQHAFHADYRPSYDRSAAEDGWQRCVGWLRGHGVA